MNLPNILSMTRLLLVPSFFLFLYYNLAGQTWILPWTRLALLIIVISDFLDGYLARKRGEITALGSVLDPMADKLFVIASFILLTVYSRIPPWLTIIVVAKDILISVGWCVTAVLFQKVSVNPTKIGKAATALQYLLVCIIVLVPPYFPLGGLEFITGIVTGFALVHYLYLGIQQTNGIH